jgi:hypothetical protein
VPNWTQITVGRGVNRGEGVERARAKGYIFPEDLRSPIWPDGIKPRCQFRDCFGEDLQSYTTGTFCREIEAKMVFLAEGPGRDHQRHLGVLGIVGGRLGWDLQKQADQIASINVAQ